MAQGFSIQTLAQFLGLFLGPMIGGFVEWRFGWKVMVGWLGGIAGGTAVLMGWVSSGRKRVDIEEGERERERLLISE